MADFRLFLVTAEGDWHHVEGAYLIDTDEFPEHGKTECLGVLAFGTDDERVNYADAHGTPLGNVLHRAGYTV